MPTFTDEQYITAIQNAEKAGQTDAAQRIALEWAKESAQTQDWRGFQLSAMQGLSFGLADEIVGAISGENAQQTMRSELESFRKRNPWLSLGAELVGSLPTGAGLGTTAATTARMPGILGSIGRTVTRPTVGGQASLGAAEGAIYGAATGETPEERLTGGLVGAGLGAVGGSGSGVVSGAITRATRPGMLAEDIVSQNIARDLGRQPTYIDYAQLAQRARERPELTLAEIPGQSTQLLARTVSSLPQGGMREMRETLTERATGASGRMVQELRRLTGAQGDYFENLEELGRQRSAQARPLYERAYQAPFAPDASEELTEVTKRGFRTGDLRKAYNQARTEAMREGEVGIPTWRELIRDEDSIAGLNLRTFDLFKQGLDARYRDLVRTRPSEARSLYRYRQDLVRALDVAAPEEYQQARAAYAGPSRQMEAMEAGRDIMREDASVTQQMVESMSEAEREAYVLGAIEPITRKLQSRPRRMGGVASIPEYVENRMRWAFPSNEAFEEFLDTLDAEVDMQGFKNMIMNRTVTADIQQGQQDLSRAGGMSGIAGEVLLGNFGEAARRVWQTIKPSPAAIPESMIDPLTRMLMTQGPEAVSTLQRLQRPPVIPQTLPPITTTEFAILANQLQQ